MGFLWNKGSVNIWNDSNLQKWFVHSTCKYFIQYLTLRMVCLHMMLTAIWLSWNSERRTCNCGGYSLLWGCRSDNPKSVQWFYSCHRDHPMGYLREQNSYNCLPFMKQSRSRLVSRITACVISWVATTSMGAVIARSNIIWFCTQHNRDWSGTYVTVNHHNMHRIPRPHGRAMGCPLWQFWRNLTAL